MNIFDTTKLPLSDVIESIKQGKLQLPEFQRDWVWDEEHVRSLLVSIARSFPIGAVMLLETGGNVRFQVRPIENVRLPGNSPEPERLILDGQQRLTSLTQVLGLQQAVQTFNDKDKPVKRYFYIDIKTALDGDIENAFVAVDEHKQIRANFGRDIVLDLSRPEQEYEQLYFPCNRIFDRDDWEMGLFSYARESQSTYMLFRQKILKAFSDYFIPVITLTKENSREAVCQVFEKVNTGGVSLSVFELMTAAFAAEMYQGRSLNLREDWYGHKDRNIIGRVQRLHEKPVLQSIEPTDFLQAVTLLHSLNKRRQDIRNGNKTVAAISAKRSAILQLRLADYLQWADKAEQGFIRVAHFLEKQCIYEKQDLPYRSQLTPLAVVMVHLGERWLEYAVSEKLARWYWCGVFGELYGGAVETRMANDVEDLSAWIDGENSEEPRTVSAAAFQANRLWTLRSRQSAAYKGLNRLILREGARDFLYNDTVEELRQHDIHVDIHHIMPKDFCRKQQMPASRYDSVINKTPISSKANRKIGGREPSEYLRMMQESLDKEHAGVDMAEILRTHLIDYDALNSNDFERFCASRAEKLLQLIEEVTGKKVIPE